MVMDAWNRGQELTIHGWIYDLKDGLIRDLGISIGNQADLRSQRDGFLFNDKRRVSAEASK